MLFMRSTYDENDVVLLLKDITGMVEPLGTAERERLIQSGRHYCEMLPIEYIPSEEYMRQYENAVLQFSGVVADSVGILSDKIMAHKNNNPVIVSLARAGIPIGILIKRFIRMKYKKDIAHYSVSIIRGVGIDKNAIDFILKRHNADDIIFVDGWVGKGAILNELKKALLEFEGISSDFAVISDPAYVTELCGTHEDILIPSSCLNCTVSGLISRTFYRKDIIGEKDFHGAVFYENLLESDLSYKFIESVQNKFMRTEIDSDEEKDEKKIIGNRINRGIEEVKKIAEQFKITDINLIKPGLGETTRVLLRRVPHRVLISKIFEKEHGLDNGDIIHILRLAEEKGVPVEYYDLKNYKACGIIKKMGDI